MSEIGQKYDKMIIKPNYPIKIFKEPYYNGIYTGVLIGTSLVYISIGVYDIAIICIALAILSFFVYTEYINK